MKYLKQALILAAGKGMRLKNMTNCKALLNINEKPLICNIMDNLIYCGISDFYIVVYYKDDFDVLDCYYKNKAVNIFYIKDYERKGSLWSFCAASNYINPPFVCTDCDLIVKNNDMINMFNDGINSLLNDHYDGVVARVVNPSRYDVNMLAINGKIAQGFDKRGGFEMVRGGYVYIWNFENIFFEANSLVEKNIYSFSSFNDYIFKKYYIGIMNVQDIWDVDCPEDANYANKIFLERKMEICQ